MSRIMKPWIVILAISVAVLLCCGGCAKAKSKQMPESRTGSYTPGPLRLLYDWTLRSTGEGFSDIIWADNQFVAVCGRQVYTSPDGVMWIEQVVQPAGTTVYFLESVAWSGTQFVVVGDHGVIFTSPDGDTWTKQNSLTTKQIIKDD